MRSYPDSSDSELLAQLKVQSWQVDLLKKNNCYPHWGNHEDYMWKKGDAGWDRPVEINSLSELFGLDEYNELVNFYFFLHRKNHECPHCGGTNLNPATKQLEDDWYDYSSRSGHGWSNKLTEVEIEALVRGGRMSDLLDSWYHFNKEKNTWEKLDVFLPYDQREWVPCDAPKMPTPEKVNGMNDGRGFNHDAINRWICVEARAKHLGIYGHCEHCDDGYIYDEPEGKVGIQMWILHPRKGCSRGVILNEIKQEEIPQIIEYLKEAAERNAERFNKLDL